MNLGPSSSPPLPAFLRRHIGLLAIAAAGLVMLCWTWGTWPDVLIDFGSQLYIPWQLSSGKVLYTDIAYYNGPLSQYANALAFHLFGVGLWTLVACNFAILIGLVLLLRSMLAQIGSRWSADLACLGFILLFAFAQQVTIGNYNYLCPYAHEMTHGLLFSLLALAAIWQYPRWGLRAIALAGASLGLAFLTKSEVFIGGLAGALAALALTLWKSAPGWRQALLAAGILLTSALAPPLIAFLALQTVMPQALAIRGVLGSWMIWFAPAVTNLLFFRRGLGIDDVPSSLHLLAIGSLWYAVALAAAFALAWAAGKFVRKSWLAAGLIFTGVLVLSWWLVPASAWRNSARPFPLILLLCGAILGLRFLRTPSTDPNAAKLVRQCSLVVLAFVLLAKMLLNVRFMQYGFVLTMPATLLLIVAALDWLPAVVRRAGGSAPAFAAAMLALIAALVASGLQTQSRLLAAKTIRVGQGVDSFWADPRGISVNKALEELSDFSPPSSTLAVLPGGVMLNYLARRINPTPYINFVPTEVFYFGDEQIASAFQAHSPDWLMLVEQDTSEFGFRYFGTDYGLPISRYLTDSYRSVGVVGSQPLRDGHFGISIAKKRDAASPLEPSPAP